MRCPRCNHESLDPFAPCFQCGFTGPPPIVEELGHVSYLLGEIESWTEIEAVRDAIRTRYLARRKELEVELGLRPGPLTPQEARDLYWELFIGQRLADKLADWQARGWLAPDEAESLIEENAERIERLKWRLSESAAGPSFDSPHDSILLLDTLARRLAAMRGGGALADEHSYRAASAQIRAQREEAEIAAGLRARPVVPAPVPPAAAVVEAEEREPAPVRPPRPPFSWDRVWQTLLSEKTLNVILFLGAFLLIASAATYVVTNWERLPPAVQLGFILLVTLAFYAGGWFLRVRMGLRASSIALTAVGSLLVPVDSYGVLIAGGTLPFDAWPWVWLGTSAVCLPIYTFTGVRLKAPFFGYVVAATAGSLVAAALKVAGLLEGGWGLGLAAVALLLGWLAYRRPAALFSASWRFAALIGTAVILCLGVGLQMALTRRDVVYGISLAGSWLLGTGLYAYGARREQSPLLVRAAATAAPGAALLALRPLFDAWQIEWPWYAAGWAVLGCAYLLAGRRAFALSGSTAALWAATGPAAGQAPDESLAANAGAAGDVEAGGTEAAPEPGSAPAEGGGGAAESAAGPTAGDPLLVAVAQTAVGWGFALMAAAALASPFDLWAGAVTHLLLAAGALLAIRAWDRPRFLPAASVLALTGTSFGMAAGHVQAAALGVGWALLAVLHVVAAIGLRRAPRYAARLFAVALPLAGLAVLPAAILGEETLSTYAVGQWIGLAAWLLWLDRGRAHAGLEAVLDRLGPLRTTALHWAAAIPLPVFAALFYTRFRAPDAWLGLVLALVAGACLAGGLAGHPRRPRGRLEIAHPSFPWLSVAWVCSVAGPALAFYYFDLPLLGVTVLAAAAVYFASAWGLGVGAWLVAAGLAMPGGVLLLLGHWGLDWAQQSVALALIVAAYLLGGRWLERRGTPRPFLAWLYGVGHGLAVVALVWGWLPAAWRGPWTDAAKVWAAAGELVLALTYGALAWLDGLERWAHVGVWLSALGGGLVALAYGQGRGSSAFKVAVLAIAYVLAERALANRAARGGRAPGGVPRAGAGRAWPIFRRPLLIAGWTVSGVAIGLALVRNLILLGAGWSREMWAVAALLAVTALYAASARLFRRRLFLWLAGGLIAFPWTVLAGWGWFLWQAPPPLARYGLSWIVLAWAELLIGLVLTPSLRTRAAGKGEYGFPLRAIAHGLMPLALVWGGPDVGLSTLSLGLGLAFYLLSAAADHRRGLAGRRAARFLYPAVALAPVWGVYLLGRWLPASPYESYGILLLALALPLLAAGRWIRRLDPADGTPLYLGAYGVAIAGTLLVAGQRPLLAWALAFDVGLCLLSAWLFREPLWVYPAVALAPAGLLVALAESAVPPDRRGWWLIGLGAVYVAAAWLLRRVKRPEYAVPPIAAAFVVVALGLAPSSVDDVGAFWGYLAGALLYAALAIWLGQPLLLTPAAGLLAVPYDVGLVWLGVGPADHGLALFPGVVAALAAAHVLDRRLGRPPSLIPAAHPRSWRLDRWLDWWGGPFYGLAYAGALIAVAASRADPGRLALTLALAAAAFLHATWRFRLRPALLAAGMLAQGAVVAAIDAGGWLRYPAWAALAFLPATAATALLAWLIQHRRGEGPPLSRAWWAGWSRPLYLLFALDLAVGQMAGLMAAEPGAAVTGGHALLLAFLVTSWGQPWLPLAPLGLGLVALVQAMSWAGAEYAGYAVALAGLGLAYGLAGYALRMVTRRAQVWLLPLEWAGLGISVLAVLMLSLSLDPVVRLLVWSALDRPIEFAAYQTPVWTTMWVLGLNGLLYLATAFVRRWRLMGYGAVALLLAAWGLWWRFFLSMPGFQWYAVPAGAYLLGIGWLECRAGNRRLARWIDRAGMLAWLGSSWWQSLPGVTDHGWRYGLIMGAEALLLVWWGSARRARRFLYVGVVGVVLTVITQSIEPLLTVNRWIVFGVAGLLLTAVAVFVERRLDKIREFSAGLRQRMEAWE